MTRTDFSLNAVRQLSLSLSLNERGGAILGITGDFIFNTDFACSKPAEWRDTTRVTIPFKCIVSAHRVEKPQSCMLFKVDCWEVASLKVCVCYMQTLQAISLAPLATAALWWLPLVPNMKVFLHEMKPAPLKPFSYHHFFFLLNIGSFLISTWLRTGKIWHAARRNRKLLLLADTL